MGVTGPVCYVPRGGIGAQAHGEPAARLDEQAASGGGSGGGIGGGSGGDGGGGDGGGGDGGGVSAYDAAAAAERLLAEHGYFAVRDAGAERHLLMVTAPPLEGEAPNV